MPSTHNILLPSAPAFLDPLYDLDSCFCYAPPRFCSFQHPNTRWLIAMIKANEEDTVRRKVELNPDLIRGRYFQMVDNPAIYRPDDLSTLPMFRTHTVLYLSALGIALYLRSLPLVDLFLFYKDSCDTLVSDPNEPQFASHVQDLNHGDFHAFPPSVVMLRMRCFEATVNMQKAGWNPSQPLALPMRRKYERRAFYFFDWLEAGLVLLYERPQYPLKSLLLNMTRDMGVYKFLKLPLVKLLPPTPKQRIPTGLVNVEDLPVGTKMIGTRSLLEMAQDYHRYLQMRSCSIQVNELKKKAAAFGLNTNILMSQVQDYDVTGKQAEEAEKKKSGRKGVLNYSQSNSSRWYQIGRPQLPDQQWRVEPESRQQRPQLVNANNSAAQSKQNEVVNYVSEGVRVIHYALEKDRCSKRMQMCLDSVAVMAKRGFYCNSSQLKADSPRARDLRNLVVLMLNLIQREQDKLTTQSATVFNNLQLAKMRKRLENRRVGTLGNIGKITGIITRLLLQSKQFVYFASAQFPPYPARAVDFVIDPKLQNSFSDVQINVIREFNSIKDAWAYLTKDMLHELSQIELVQMQFRVGREPNTDELVEGKEAAGKHALKMKQRDNMSNTNSCFVSFTKVVKASPAQQSKSKIANDPAILDNVKNDSNYKKALDQPSATSDIDNWLCETPTSLAAAGSASSVTKCKDENVTENIGVDNVPDDEDEAAQLLNDLAECCDCMSETSMLISSLNVGVPPSSLGDQYLKNEHENDTIEPELDFLEQLTINLSSDSSAFQCRAFDYYW